MKDEQQEPRMTPIDTDVLSPFAPAKVRPFAGAKGDTVRTTRFFDAFEEMAGKWAPPRLEGTKKEKLRTADNADRHG